MWRASTSHMFEFKSPRNASKTFEADWVPGLAMRTKINPSFQSVSLNTVSISSVGTEKEGRQRLLRRAEYRSELDVTLCASDTRRRKHQLEALTERVGPSLLCSKVSHSPDFLFLTCLEMTGRGCALEKCPSHLRIKTVVKIPAPLQLF